MWRVLSSIKVWHGEKSHFLDFSEKAREAFTFNLHQNRVFHRNFRTSGKSKTRGEWVEMPKRETLLQLQNIFHTDCKDCGDVWSKRWHHFQKASARPFPFHGDSFFSKKHLNSQLFNQNGNQEEQTCKIGFSICIFLDNSCQVKRNTQKLFFCPMQRPAMARKSTSDPRPR